MNSKKDAMSGQIKQELSSGTTGVSGNKDASDVKIKTPKPVDHSGQSGFGEQEPGTGIGKP